jgi:hypothetical protein
MIVREMESRVVPSVMVLVLGDDASLSTVADAVVAGAKRVRFTEVTTRAAKPDVFRYRLLDSDVSLASFDGVVFVAASNGSAASEVERVRGAQPLTNTVVARAVARAGGRSDAATDAAIDAALVGLGGVVVSASSGGSEVEDASAVGERVAKVAGWVRHSLGHEAEHRHHAHSGHAGEHHHDHHHS